MLLVPCEYSYSTGKWEDYISSDVCALRWYLGKLSLNFIAFCKSGSGRRKRAKTNTSFDMCSKWTNKKIFEEFERNKNLGCLSKYAFEQLFHSLSQENGDCYTSCHLVPAQQHCICCTPQKFFLKEGSVINLPIWNQTIILVVLLIVLCQSSKSVISKKKRWTFFFFLLFNCDYRKQEILGQSRWFRRHLYNTNFFWFSVSHMTSSHPLYLNNGIAAFWD